MLNQWMPVSSRTRSSNKKEVRPAKKIKKLPRKSSLEDSSSKYNEADIIELDVSDKDEGISIGSSDDDPLTSTSGEDNEDSEDLDWDEEEEEVEVEVEAVAVAVAEAEHGFNAGRMRESFEIISDSEWIEGKTSQIQRTRVGLGSPVYGRNEDDSSSGDGEGDFSADDEGIIDLTVPKTKISVGEKRGRGRPRGSSNSSKRINVLKVLVNSILAGEEDSSSGTSLEEVLIQESLCLKSGVNQSTCPEETELDSLWAEMQFSLASSQIGSTDASVVDDIPENEHDTATLCRQGNHHLILDEEIGMQCKYCSYVHLESRYISPPFLTEPYGKYERQSTGMVEPCLFDGLDFQDPNDDDCDRCTDLQGTVWEIIPGVKSKLYPHQREGFEFIWNNIAGGIYRDKSKNSSNTCGGCIISHAPGTGKSLLTIVFLYTYLKENPRCRPVIIAPCSMLLTWEAEFKKWNVDIPFHNLNAMVFSGNEKTYGIGLYEKYKRSGHDRPLAIRLVKLLSWKDDGGILGVSYKLFEKLVGRERKGKGKCTTFDRDVARILLEFPGLFVLDEGHTPRNDKSLMWKALSMIKTERRIFLSGTPFQNNFKELFNTLCLVRPKFAEGIQSRHQKKVDKRRHRKNEAKLIWSSLTGSIGKDNDRHEAELENLRALIEPFVHVHKGTVLQTSLPGLRHSVVVLQPSDLQKKILEHLKETKNISTFDLDHSVSLISVHPSLLQQLADDKVMMESLSSIVSMDELKRIRLMLDKGVKTKFLKELLCYSEVLNERVIVFGQYLHPLNLIMDQLQECFKWKEGEEILYMDGHSDINNRQSSINAFNDPTSKAKVMLATIKACSEGINLIGGSRVVLLDVTWNPSVERQAISRAYRLGQKRIVYVYHLISSGTMEGMKCYRQAKKDRLSQLVFCSSAKGDDHQKEVQNVLEDKVLEEMFQQEKLKSMFEKIINQPKYSNLMDIFVDL